MVSPSFNTVIFTKSPGSLWNAKIKLDWSYNKSQVKGRVTLLDVRNHISDHHKVFSDKGEQEHVSGNYKYYWIKLNLNHFWWPYFSFSKSNSNLPHTSRTHLLGPDQHLLVGAWIYALSCQESNSSKGSNKINSTLQN